jgi:hypothetical protein
MVWPPGQTVQALEAPPVEPKITGCPGKHVLFPECIKGLTFDVPPSAAFRSEKHEDSSDDKR